MTSTLYVEDQRSNRRRGILLTGHVCGYPESAPWTKCAGNSVRSPTASPGVLRTDTGTGASGTVDVQSGGHRYRVGCPVVAGVPAGRKDVGY